MSEAGARVEIDTAALRQNLRGVLGALRSGSASQLCAVVKSDAYGHGIDTMLPLIMAEGVPVVGIASNREARQVRALGYEGRILRVRSAGPVEVAEALQWRVEEWVGGFLHARSLAEIAVSRGIEVPVHLATNGSGLSKENLDLRAPSGASELAALVALRGLDIRGVCTHFAREDEADTRAGLRAFVDDAERVLRALGAGRAEGVQRHCATSFASLTVPESRLEMARVGAALYGDTSAQAPWQRPALRLVAPVSAVTGYPAGRTVGYERRHTLERDSVIATVPLGYGDGLPRALGGGGHVLIRGRRAPIVDHLAMNSLAVDVTRIAGVVPGDEAVVFGRQGARGITSAQFEAASGQIAAASYTVWGRVLPRVVGGAAPEGRGSLVA